MSSPQPFSPIAQRRTTYFALVAVLMLLLLPACDLVGEEDPLELPATVEFRFEFSTVGQVGDPVTVQSEEMVDIEDELFAEGYTRDDIAIANITSVSVERLQPVGTDLDVFDQIELTLRAPGVNVPTHASSDDLPSDNTAALAVRAAGISEVVWEPEFSGELTVIPTVEDDFVLQVEVDMRIDIQEN